MKRLVASAICSSLVLSGCATSSKDIAPTYVSPLQYQNYDCEQIAGEIRRIQVRVNQLSGRLDEAAANDKAIAGVGAILFWPALFALGGTKQQEAEYARLRGEYDALEQAAVIKKCPGAIPPSQKTASPGGAETAPLTAPAPVADPAAAPGLATSTAIPSR
jgi:outer membrane murein-binding lipoprotein Lpp